MVRILSCTQDMIRETITSDMTVARTEEFSQNSRSANRLLTFSLHIDRFHSKTDLITVENEGKIKTVSGIRKLFFSDPYENRTRVAAVKGRCLNLLTKGPNYGSGGGI